MVLKYDVYGSPYREPPYSEDEELEIYRSLCGVAVITSPNYRRSLPNPQPHQDQELPPKPEETHPC